MAVSHIPSITKKIEVNINDSTFVFVFDRDATSLSYPLDICNRPNPIVIYISDKLRKELQHEFFNDHRHLGIGNGGYIRLTPRGPASFSVISKAGDFFSGVIQIVTSECRLNEREKWIFQTELLERFFEIQGKIIMELPLLRSKAKQNHWPSARSFPQPIIMSHITRIPKFKFWTFWEQWCEYDQLLWEQDAARRSMGDLSLLSISQKNDNYELNSQYDKCTEYDGSSDSPETDFE